MNCSLYDHQKKLGRQPERQSPPSLVEYAGVERSTGARTLWDQTRTKTHQAEFHEDLRGKTIYSTLQGNGSRNTDQGHPGGAFVIGKGLVRC